MIRIDGDSLDVKELVRAWSLEKAMENRGDAVVYASVKDLVEDAKAIEKWVTSGE